MTETGFFETCPRCGYLAEAWTENGVFMKLKCKMCGYSGKLPHVDLKNGISRVG